MAVLVDVAPGLSGVVDVHQVEQDATVVLGAAGMPQAELSVLLTDDAVTRALNREWRGKDATTDVLSFPQGEPEGPVFALGDVIINVELAARQADERGHPTLTEVRVLLVHGLAHLLGHDHHEPDDAVAMRAVERALLGAVFGGIAPPGLVETALG